MQPLTRREVRTIDRTGGTFLHTSRTNPAKVKLKDVPAFPSTGQFESEGRSTSPATAQVIERLGLDWLVAIGGDDTLSYAERLSRRASWPCPRRWTTTSSAPTTASASSTAVTRSVQFIHHKTLDRLA